MICPKSDSNFLGLWKQGSTNSTCVADVEEIIIRLANDAVNKIMKQWPVQYQQPIHRDHANEMAPMVHADDTGQITI